MYHTKSLHIPLGCLNLPKRQVSTCPDLLIVSYVDALSRRFLGDTTLTLYLRMNIGSVLLIYYISIGTILALDIDYISTYF